MNEQRIAHEQDPAETGASLPAGLELRYIPGEADRFIARLREQVLAHPDGPSSEPCTWSATAVRLCCGPATRQSGSFRSLPGQVLITQDNTDPRTWTVTDGPPAYAWASRPP